MLATISEVPISITTEVVAVDIPLFLIKDSMKTARTTINLVLMKLQC